MTTEHFSKSQEQLGAATPPPEVVDLIVHGQHANVFEVLGLQALDASNWAVRVFAPTAEHVSVETLKGVALAQLTRVHDGGFFVGVIPHASLPEHAPLIYAASSGENREHSWRWVDSYTFGPVLGPIDDYYFSAGTHLKLFDKLGAHPMTFEGVSGVHFAVWAPNASKVSVVGDFNDWDGRRHVMRCRTDSGVWEIFVPDLPEGSVYKYELYDSNHELLALKADPLAQASQMRPANGSKVVSTWDFKWTDDQYLKNRAEGDPRHKPMSTYEVHLGSWQRSDDGGFLSYDDLIERLIPYVTEMGYSHIEVLPITEHPLDASWGYQPTGLFSPTARFGEPDGFARFVDAAHGAGIGVILDWVPAHFPTDAHGLAYFDGTALYEHEDVRKGFHPDWNTAIFNFGRTEVAQFLMNNALFWLERYHLDGLRVDAVASMLYLDYSRKEGEWIPNELGGRENLEAIEFLRSTNTEVYAAHKGVVTIAEESTSFPGVSHPVDEGGLGFGFKWNMGFMHDTLAYFKQEPIHRKYHHNELTFGVTYAFAENFVLPLSHDEVVHGKGTLLTKMSGDDWQKFANLRAYYGFMWGYPGKKLLFMGQEFAQRAEWNENIGLDWCLLDYPAHRGVQDLVRDLNHLHQTLPALHEKDCEGDGFEWLIVDDNEQSVFAWVRRGFEGTKSVVVVCNLTPVPRHGYRVPMPWNGRWVEKLNSDAHIYGGTGMGNLGEVWANEVEGEKFPAFAEMTLPPLSTLMFELD